MTALPMSPKYLAIVLKPATGEVIGGRRVNHRGSRTTKEVSLKKARTKDGYRWND